jgi:hypothetical protein
VVLAAKPHGQLEHLDRDVSIDRELLGSVNRAESAMTDLVLDSVLAPEHLADQRVFVGVLDGVLSVV